MLPDYNVSRKEAKMKSTNSGRMESFGVPNFSSRPVIPYYCEVPDYEMKFAKDGDAGYDLPIWDDRLNNGEWGENGEITLQPMESKTIKTGVYMGIPNGKYGDLDSRSGTSKAKLILLCHTIDSPYIGNIRLAILNLNTEPVTIKNGQSLFQIVIKDYTEAFTYRCKSKEDFLDIVGETSRGSKGFGSTGRGYEGGNK